MEKHKLIRCRVEVNDCDLISNSIDIQEVVKYQLVREASDVIMKDNLFVLSQKKDDITNREIFQFGLVVINPDDYEKLQSVIQKYNFKFVDEEGNVKYLRDLL